MKVKIELQGLHVFKNAQPRAKQNRKENRNISGGYQHLVNQLISFL